MIKRVGWARSSA